MFGNELFDQWLNQKSLEILGKVEKEKISTEDMLILSLKAQTNHFHHMDEEFRAEFKKIDDRFTQVDKKFEKIDQRFEHLDQKIDKRVDRLTTIMMWEGGILITLISGLYFKLFLG